MVRFGAIGAAFSVLSLIFSSGSVPAQVHVNDLSTQEWETIWASVLMRHVNNAGQIDFSALQQDRGNLERVIAFIASVAGFPNLKAG